MEQTSFYKSRQFQVRLYGILCVILVSIIGFYSYTNVTKMLDMRTNISTYNQLHNSLSETDGRLDDELGTIKETNSELVQKIQSELGYVLPGTENHTDLTRTLESFANDVHRSRNPFMINSLQYQSPQKAEEGNYNILPFSLSIHSSHENFFKFLAYIDNSGTLSEKTRLLDIQKIVINFVSPQGTQGNISGADEINFNISMHAYFQSTQ
jgi:hypothetical protein